MRRDEDGLLFPFMGADFLFRYIMGKTKYQDQDIVKKDKS